MRTRTISFIIYYLLFFISSFTASAQYKSEVWSPDNGDGTYTNPVLYADYSDPDVCAVGEDYYLTASSFNCIPGLPILHSKDLVNWEIIGHALSKLEPAELFDQPQHGKGIWAPSIRHHDGAFYIYWGDPDHGIFMVRATDPAGEWESPVCVIPGKGMIDPCPLWDDDGHCYLVHAWAASRVGFNSVLTVRELSADGTRTIGQPRIVFDGGQENHTAEGPKFYKRDGWYWIMCPAGGVEKGWQLAMRSRSPYGPYEWKRVMEQGKTNINGPHQGGWVHTAFDEDWFLHFNDKGAYGRVVYLQPVDWSSGWPMMGKNGEPLTTFRKPHAPNLFSSRSGNSSLRGAAAIPHSSIFNPQESDEFNGGIIGKQWQWHANYNPLYGMPTADGTMRLYTWILIAPATPLPNGRGQVVGLWNAPNLLLQKPTAPRFTATAKVRFTAKEEGQYGGLIMMGRDYSALVICREGESFQLQRHTCIGADEGKAEQITTLVTLKPTERDTIPYAPAIHLDLYLRLTVKDGACTFAYSTDGKRFREAGDNFTMKEGKWIGAKFGFVAEQSSRQARRGWLDVDWIHITK